MHTIHWQVAAGGLPLIKRACPCGHGLYESSGLFRINACGNKLDVWLIYRCPHCKHSYNLSIYTRVSPAWLERTGQYAALLANAAELADSFARNRALLAKNRVELVSTSSGTHIDGPLPIRGSETYIVLHCTPGTHLRLDKLLGQKLGLSRSEAKAALQDGRVACTGTASHNAGSAKRYTGSSLVTDGMLLWIAAGLYSGNE